MRPTRPGRRRYEDRLIVGTPGEVAAVLGTAARRGVLVAATVAHPVPGDPSRVAVKARMVATGPPRTTVPARVTVSAITGPSRPVCRVVARSRPVRHRTARRVGVLAAVAVGAAVALVVVGYAAVWLIAAAWPILLAVAVLLFLLRRVQVRSGVCCPGLHCPGCRH